MANTIVLYLRPFSSDGKITVPNPDKNVWRNLLPTSANGTPGRVSIETLILKCCEGIGELIAIGRTIEVIGAGKVIASDSCWKDDFRRLAERAACIVSVPSTHPSTLWELNWLASQKLCGKTLVLFTDLHLKGELFPHFDLRGTTSRLREEGWRLPSPVVSGTIVRFGADGVASDYVRNPKYKPGLLRSAIEQVARGPH